MAHHANKTASLLLNSIKLLPSLVNVAGSPLLKSIVKPDLHEPQPPVEWSVTLISFIAVERRC